MKPKRKRLIFVLVGLGILTVAVGLVLTALRDDIVFFYSPSELKTMTALDDRNIRIGGLVEAGSIVHGEGASVIFAITDTAESVKVVYNGILPDLFREEQGVVLTGRLGPDGIFQASEVLAKHDETYMPPEVAEALKKAGQWKGKDG